MEDRIGAVINEEVEQLAQGQHAKVSQRVGVEGEGVNRVWVCERSGVGWEGGEGVGESTRESLVRRRSSRRKGNMSR